MEQANLETARNGNFISRHPMAAKTAGAMALAGVLLGGWAYARTKANYAEDNCSGQAHIQIDEVPFWSVANLGRMANGDFQLGNPHNYEQLADVVTDKFGYTVTAEDILNQPENIKRAEKKGSIWPVTTTDRFDSPGLYCVALPGPKKVEQPADTPVPVDDVVFVQGTPPSFNNLSSVGSVIFRGDENDRKRVDALYDANYQVVDVEGKRMLQFMNNVTVYNSQRVRDFVTNLPGITNQNAALARIAKDEKEAGLAN